MIEFLGAESRNGEAERDAATALAKARLNDAAPDMLEALENIENDAEHMPDTAWRMVQDAIAKATEGDA